MRSRHRGRLDALSVGPARAAPVGRPSRAAVRAAFAVAGGLFLRAIVGCDDRGAGAAGVPASAVSADWCAAHEVPESVCTRCNAGLIARFKESGDWCGEHGLPESHCVLCNPQVREKWAALRPRLAARAESLAVPDAESLTLERVPRPLTPGGDPLCQVDTLRVRFYDASIAHQAGIQTEPVQSRRLSALIDAPAEVEFDETRVTRITPRVAGVARDVPARLGDSVRAGDLLAVIESPALGEAKSAYIECKGNHLLAQADRRRMATIHAGTQRMLETVTADSPADEIRKQLEGVPVGEAKARLLRAHAAYQLARAEAARETQLRAKQIGSARDYDAAASALSAAEADFLATREEVAFQSARDLLAAERAAEIARAALEAAERRLHLLGLTDEQVQAVGSEPAGGLTRYELRSPADGRVVERRVAPGEGVEPRDVLFVVADPSRMWLLADVRVRDLPLLRDGLRVLFTVDDLPGVNFEGRTAWISSAVDDRTRTVRVRADLPNDEGLLRARMFGQARLIVHDDDAVLSVPAEAVQTDGCCQLVFVRETDAVFAPRKVTLGARASGYVEVLRGLAQGEQVAAAGSFLLKTEILKSNIGAGCCEVDPGR